MIVKESDDKVVGNEQGSGADKAAQDAVVFANDGVLYGVRERQQNDQIEWIELDEFTFSREPQADHQERVNNDRAEDLLQKRKSHNKHIFPNVVHRAMASSEYL